MFSVTADATLYNQCAIQAVEMGKVCVCVCVLGGGGDSRELCHYQVCEKCKAAACLDYFL